MKIIVVTSIVLFCTCSVSVAQVSDQAKLAGTKMDVFVSKTGVITKFTDYKLEGFKISFGLVETRIRKLSSGGELYYFFQIEKRGQYGSSTASIESSDILEVIKAIASLKLESQSDLSVNPDYLQNKFTTVDGFQVGYYIQKGKIQWYLKLDDHGSDNSAFVENVGLIEAAFSGARLKIEQLSN